MNGRPIRALFVVPDLHVGGAERHVTTLLPRLDPRQVKASVLCIGEEGGLFAELLDAGIEARALHLTKRQAPRALLQLVSILRRDRPDVVVVRGYNAEVLGRAAARIAGVRRTVVWVHNISDITRRTGTRIAVDRILASSTSAYFGVAQAQRRYLVDHLGYSDHKIRIIRNGVDPSQFGLSTDRRVLREFGFAHDAMVVGILAALRPEKDHATFLRAARIVIDAVPAAKFLVVGDGPMRGALEALAADLGIDGDVHFAGTRSDVARVLGALDVFALSSVTECFPMALLEAMACARPAVCTAVGGLPEMVEDGRTGFLVAPADAVQLAGRLIGLLSDQQAARQMGRLARHRVVNEFSLDQSVAAAQQAIEDVVLGQLTTSERS